ncbi:hypothetical protein A2791_00155 [Candidatus Saccharibacteria bacterium RIFCSPHIGHO2_01_FULL_46_30]|nr:MAG: hypothetical protein A2791_00155 [Candidatus Saccharibacteria bacterium RIFCSPHIGHO2_01_FULL_46_30]
MKKIIVNIVSESDISVQGHGVHTAYDEMARALERRSELKVIRGRFGELVDCDIVHLHTIGSRTWRKLLQKGPKKVVSVHVVPDSFVGSIVMARFWRFAASWYMRWFYGRADLLLAVSEETKRDLLDMGIKRPIVVEYNTIDTTRYKRTSSSLRDEYRKKLGIPESAFVVMGAGQVQPRKRLDSFAAAAIALPDVYFVWVGGMPFGKIAADSTHMEKIMTDAPKNLLFPGIVDIETMPAYYQAADIFFLPSDQETFGLVVLEAAASGLPVIVRNLPDYKDSFGDDVMQCDEDEFVNSIRRLKRSKKVYAEWSEKSARIAERFDSTAAAERYVELYRNLI